MLRCLCDLRSMSKRDRFASRLVAAGLLALMCTVGSAYAQVSNRDQCIAGAAAHYLVHPYLIRAVLRQEGGRVGAVSWNKNHTYDIGPMQINSEHLAELAQYGITRDALLTNECLNILIGTWYLKRELVATPNLWVGIGNYHSHTASLNTEYQWDVWKRLREVENGQ